MKTNVFIIVESDDTIPSKVKLFFSAEDAGRYLQRRTHRPIVGFRKKRKAETWEKYLNEWNEFAYDTNGALLVTGTWNIHWFKIKGIHWP